VNAEGAAPAIEGPENRAERSALEEALESRATRAYEQQQEGSHHSTNIPQYRIGHGKSLSTTCGMKSSTRSGTYCFQR
jgi:hypothetical protein